jgi:carbonic anhydrase
MHIVHANENKTRLSVIAVFFDLKAGGNASNWFLQKVVADDAKTSNYTEYKVHDVNIKKLVEELNPQKLYHYDGSLTTPACDEIVEWVVVHDPQTISPAQLNFFTKKWAKNNVFAAGRGNNRVT